MIAPAKTRWVEFWRRLGLTHDPARLYAELEGHYTESPRAYHNLAHILDCLRELATAKHLAQDVDAIELAIWYHDVIYDSWAKDNEERSAELAEKVGRENGLPDRFRERVRTLILATK